MQSIHSGIEAAKLIPPDFQHPSVVLIGIPNEAKLQKQLDHLQSLGIICKPFYDNIFDNQLTAFATEPILDDKRHIFKKYQLIRQSHFERKSK